MPWTLAHCQMIELSYLCSTSRIDRITPEVEGFCWTVARKVNSLLFRNSWINFSLTWGAAWISLSISRSQEEREGERGGEKKERGKAKRRTEKKYRSRKQETECEKEEKRTTVKKAKSIISTLHLHLPLLWAFVFRHHPPLHTATFIQRNT